MRPACRAGEPAWCSAMQLQGGGYGEYATVAAHQCKVLIAPVPA